MSHCNSSCTPSASSRSSSQETLLSTPRSISIWTDLIEQFKCMPSPDSLPRTPTELVDAIESAQEARSIAVSITKYDPSNEKLNLYPTPAQRGPLIINQFTTSHFDEHVRRSRLLTLPLGWSPSSSDSDSDMETDLPEPPSSVKSGYKPKPKLLNEPNEDHFTTVIDEIYVSSLISPSPTDIVLSALQILRTYQTSIPSQWALNVCAPNQFEKMYMAGKDKNVEVKRCALLRKSLGRLDRAIFVFSVSPEDISQADLLEFTNVQMLRDYSQVHAYAEINRAPLSRPLALWNYIYTRCAKSGVQRFAVTDSTTWCWGAFSAVGQIAYVTPLKSTCNMRPTVLECMLFWADEDDLSPPCTPQDEDDESDIFEYPRAQSPGLSSLSSAPKLKAREREPPRSYPKFSTPPPVAPFSCTSSSVPSFADEFASNPDDTVRRNAIARYIMCNDRYYQDDMMDEGSETESGSGTLGGDS